MKILTAVGARPNFIKLAALHRAFLRHKDIESKIVHTGQHYDNQMSQVFFDQLGIPEPDYFLEVGSATPAQQVAEIMIKFEKVLMEENPSLVIVVGDVNSTLACALAASKVNISVVHVEAGLRSGDRQMPEEINRILTDQLCDHLFVSETDAMVNLKKENVSLSRIHFVGNVMIDSLLHYFPLAKSITLPKDLNLSEASYVIMTMHRSANVDRKDELLKMIQIATRIASQKKVIFPVHPRTLKNLIHFGLLGALKNVKDIYLIAPQGYLEFLKLMSNASLIITDSGGIQEESTFLQIPCITLRGNTERPVTIESGTNYLLPGLNVESVVSLCIEIFKGNGKKGMIPELWDGKASERIVRILREHYRK